MSFLAFLPAIAFSLQYYGFLPAGNLGLTSTDTTIKHVIDGRDPDWPVQQFETDPATGIRLAVDNDTANLYFALQIPQPRTQMKMSHQGMELYLDPKGKKKEGRGIEFPVKRSTIDETSFVNYGGQDSEPKTEQETAEQRKAKMRSMRTAITLGLTSMKVFGFSGDSSDEQGLMMPGSANIAFGWDSTNEMCVEYRVPLSWLGTASSLRQKEIAIGWKLNGYQRPRANETSPGSSSENRHREYGGGRNNFGGERDHRGNIPSSYNSEMASKDQSYWTRYTIR